MNIGDKVILRLDIYTWDLTQDIENGSSIFEKGIVGTITRISKNENVKLNIYEVEFKLISVYGSKEFIMIGHFLKSCIKKI